MKKKQHHKYDQIEYVARKLIELPGSQLAYKSLFDDSVLPDDMDVRLKAAYKIANGEEPIEFEGDPLEELQTLVQAQIIFGALNMNAMCIKIERVLAKWCFLEENAPELIAKKYEEIDREHLRNIAKKSRKTWKEEAVETMRLTWEKDAYITFDDMVDRIRERYRSKGVSASTIKRWIGEFDLKPKVRGHSHPFELILPSWHSAL